MDAIRIWTEDLILAMGIHGQAVPVIRHLMLIVIAALLAWLSDRLCRIIFIPLVGKLVKRTKLSWDDVLFGPELLKAICDIVPAIVVWKLLPLVFYQFSFLQEIVTRLTAIYITVASMHLGFVFINQLKKLDTRGHSNVRQYVMSFLGVLRILVVFIGVIVIIALAIGQSPLKLFAGLGATSAILMLVFKDTIEGLVAGIRLTSANMLHVGDWITVSSVGADGTVKEVSLTTVKVQNFDNTIVTISPKTLVSGSFQNWKGMQAGAGRRVKRLIYFDFRSIHYDDDEKTTTNMGRYRQAVEDYLRSNQLVNTDMTMMIRQREATQCGLPLEVYFFLKQKQWVDYEHQLAAVMEHIYCLAADFGLKIYQQYPEQ